MPAAGYAYAEPTNASNEGTTGIHQPAKNVKKLTPTKPPPARKTLTFTFLRVNSLKAGAHLGRLDYRFLAVEA